MRRVYRTTDQALVLAFLGVGSTLAMIALALWAPGLPFLVRVICSASALIWGSFIVLRAARSGVLVYAEGVRVVNPLRTHWLFWEDIAGFDVGRWTIFPKVGYLHLRTGSRVHLFGIEGLNPRTRPRTRDAEILISELNAVLGRVQRSRTSGARAAPITR